MSTAAAPVPAHLLPKQYDITCRCLLCSTAYTKRVSERAYLRILNGKQPDPPCPRKACRTAIADAEITRRARNMAQIIEQQRAPGTRSNGTVAYDATQEIVAQDYGMTNLNDASRAGDVMAPRLAPHLQTQADNFFGKKAGRPAPNPAMVAQNQRIAAAALGGSFAPAPGTSMIEQIHKAGYKPPVRIVAEG